jgi:hypothetical protein
MTFEETIKENVQLAVKEALQDVLKPRREIFTLQQLAEEWECSRQSIINWTRLPEHPLPVHYLGADPRFHRSEIEQWSRENAQRKLANAA